MLTVIIVGLLIVCFFIIVFGVIRFKKIERSERATTQRILGDMAQHKQAMRQCTEIDDYWTAIETI